MYIYICIYINGKKNKLYFIYICTIKRIGHCKLECVLGTTSCAIGSAAARRQRQPQRPSAEREQIEREPA